MSKIARQIDYLISVYPSVCPANDILNKNRYIPMNLSARIPWHFENLGIAKRWYRVVVTTVKNLSWYNLVKI